MKEMMQQTNETIPDLHHFDWLIEFIPLIEQDQNDRDKKELKFSFRVDDITNESGGLSGTMTRLTCEITPDNRLFSTSRQLHYIIKTVPEFNLARSLRNRGYREALFYRHFLTLQAELNLPSVIFTWINYSNGNKVIIMEDLSRKGGVPSNYFFSCQKHQVIDSGYHDGILPEDDRLDCIHNRSIIQSIINRLNEISSFPSLLQVIKGSLASIAKFHKRFFQSQDLLTPPLATWLGKAEHYQLMKNDDKISLEGITVDPQWQQSQDRIKSLWEQLQKDKPDLISSWNPILTRCIESSLQKINWNNYLSDLLSSSWTMIHGDFHAGNIYWMTIESSPVLLDWEMVQIGSPAQDIAHYFITYLFPDLRRTHESELLHYYYQELTSGGCDLTQGYSYEQFYSEYLKHDLERWIWLYVALWFFCSEDLGWYYHDQLVSFITDHQIPLTWLECLESKRVDERK